MPRNIKQSAVRLIKTHVPSRKNWRKEGDSLTGSLMLQSAKPWKSLTIRSSRPALCDSSARCGFQLQGKFNGTYFGSTRMKRCTKPVGKQSQMIFPSGMTQGHAMTQLRNMPSIECVCVCVFPNERQLGTLKGSQTSSRDQKILDHCVGRLTFCHLSSPYEQSSKPLLVDVSFVRSIVLNGWMD